MNYACRDCTYKGTAAGQAGECPACGSLNFGRRKKTVEAAPPSKLRLQILVVVWTIFIGMIVWKLIQ
ncbi:MAG: hypothetical protein ABJK20_03540 [Halieaceae bacterium]